MENESNNVDEMKANADRGLKSKMINDPLNGISQEMTEAELCESYGYNLAMSPAETAISVGDPSSGPPSTVNEDFDILEPFLLDPGQQKRKRRPTEIHPSWFSDESCELWNPEDLMFTEEFDQLETSLFTFEGCANTSNICSRSSCGESTKIDYTSESSNLHKRHADSENCPSAQQNGNAKAVELPSSEKPLAETTKLVESLVRRMTLGQKTKFFAWFNSGLSIEDAAAKSKIPDLVPPPVRHPNCKLSRRRLRRLSNILPNVFLQRQFVHKTYFAGADPEVVMRRLLVDLDLEEMMTLFEDQLELEELETRGKKLRQALQNEKAADGSAVEQRRNDSSLASDPDPATEDPEINQMINISQMKGDALKRYLFWRNRGLPTSEAVSNAKLLAHDQEIVRHPYCEHSWEKLLHVAKALPNTMSQEIFLMKVYFDGKDPGEVLKVILSNVNDFGSAGNGTRLKVSGDKADNGRFSVERYSSHSENGANEDDNQCSNTNHVTDTELASHTDQVFSAETVIRKLGLNQLKNFYKWCNMGFSRSDALSKAKIPELVPKSHQAHPNCRYSLEEVKIMSDLIPKKHQKLKFQIEVYYGGKEPQDAMEAILPSVCEDDSPQEDKGKECSKGKGEEKKTRVGNASTAVRLHADLPLVDVGNPGNTIAMPISPENNVASCFNVGLSGRIGAVPIVARSTVPLFVDVDTTISTIPREMSISTQNSVPLSVDVNSRGNTVLCALPFFSLNTVLPCVDVGTTENTSPGEMCISAQNSVPRCVDGGNPGSNQGAGSPHGVLPCVDVGSPGNAIPRAVSISPQNEVANYDSPMDYISSGWKTNEAQNDAILQLDNRCLKQYFCWRNQGFAHCEAFSRATTKMVLTERELKEFYVPHPNSTSNGAQLTRFARQLPEKFLRQRFEILVKFGGMNPDRAVDLVKMVTQHVLSDELSTESEKKMRRKIRINYLLSKGMLREQALSKMRNPPKKLLKELDELIEVTCRNTSDHLLPLNSPYHPYKILNSGQLKKYYLWVSSGCSRAEAMSKVFRNEPITKEMISSQFQKSKFDLDEMMNMSKRIKNKGLAEVFIIETFYGGSHPEETMKYFLSLANSPMDLSSKPPCESVQESTASLSKPHQESFEKSAAHFLDMSRDILPVETSAIPTHGPYSSCSPIPAARSPPMAHCPLPSHVDAECSRPSCSYRPIEPQYLQSVRNSLEPNLQSELNMATPLQGNHHPATSKATNSAEESTNDKMLCIILPAANPNECLTDLQMDKVEESILEAILDMDDNDPKPSFENSFRINGRYAVLCSDEFSVDWLFKYFAIYDPLDGVALKLMNRSRVKANAVLPLCSSDNDEKILRFIGKQNSRLNVSMWTVVQRWDSNGKTLINFIIDPESADVLQKCSRINFKLGTAEIITMVDRCELSSEYVAIGMQERSDSAPDPPLPSSPSPTVPPPPPDEPFSDDSLGALLQKSASKLAGQRPSQKFDGSSAHSKSSSDTSLGALLQISAGKPAVRRPSLEFDSSSPPHGSKLRLDRVFWHTSSPERTFRERGSRRDRPYTRPSKRSESSSQDSLDHSQRSKNQSRMNRSYSRDRRHTKSSSWDSVTRRSKSGEKDRELRRSASLDKKQNKKHTKAREKYRKHKSSRPLKRSRSKGSGDNHSWIDQGRHLEALPPDGVLPDPKLAGMRSTTPLSAVSSQENFSNDSQHSFICVSSEENFSASDENHSFSSRDKGAVSIENTEYGNYLQNSSMNDPPAPVEVIDLT